MGRDGNTVENGEQMIWVVANDCFTVGASRYGSTKRRKRSRGRRHELEPMMKTSWEVEDIVSHWEA